MKSNHRLNRHLFLAVALGACFVSAEGNGTSENPSGVSAPAPAAEPVVKAPGIGDVAKQLIRDGLGNKEVLEKVKAQFPDAKTTMASINWYRNNLRDNGEDVKTARELSAAGKPSAADVKAEKAKAKAEEKAASEAEKAEKKVKAKAEKDAAKAQEKADKEAKKTADKQKKDADTAASKEITAGASPTAGAADQGFLG